MGWIAQQYESEVHVVPDEAGHVLGEECWCAPRRRPDPFGGDRILLHRDQLLRWWDAESGLLPDLARALFEPVGVRRVLRCYWRRWRASREWRRFIRGVMGRADT